MIIPSQLPQFVAVTRSGALQALALQAGQILSGEVIGPAPNGGTQVQISGQLLNLVLPQAAKAGDTLRFEVQGSGAQIRLALQATASRPQLPVAPNTVPAQAFTQTPTAQATATLPVPAPSAGPPQSAATALPGPSSAAPQALPQATTAAATPASTNPAALATTAPPDIAAPAGTARQPVAAAGVPAAPGTAPTVRTATSPGVAPVNTPPAGPATPSAIGAPAQPAAGVVPRPAAPYAPAPPANAPPSANPAAAAASNTVSAAAGRVPAAALATAVAPITAASITPVFPSTPEAALAQMVQAALPQQNTVANLVAALTAIAGKVALPEPVVRAAQQVLANRVAIDGGRLDGAVLQKAMLNSGVFQEASLARAGTPLLPPQADMKSAMLALRQSLGNWLGQQPQLLASIAQPAPPLRGKIARVAALDIAPIDPAAAVEETGKHLLDRTEAALARTRLHQHASLPDPHVKGADWSADLPVVVGGQQSLLQLQIHRDQHNGSEQASERGWQMRFAINLPDMGEVGAQVSLRGSATGIMLWAAESDTTAALSADIDGLRDALSAAGLTPGAVIVRHGPPPEAPQPANSGHLVDSRR